MAFCREPVECLLKLISLEKLNTGVFIFMCLCSKLNISLMCLRFLTTFTSKLVFKTSRFYCISYKELSRAVELVFHAALQEGTVANGFFWWNLWLHWLTAETSRKDRSHRETRMIDMNLKKTPIFPFNFAKRVSPPCWVFRQTDIAISYAIWVHKRGLLVPYTIKQFYSKS